MVTAGVVLWPVAGTLAAEDRDACAILRKTDVESAFYPRKFDSGRPGYAVKGSEMQAAVSNCTYTSWDATKKNLVTVTLGVRRAPNGAPAVTPKAAKSAAVRRRATPVDVHGLGHPAFWVSIGSKAFPVFELNVFRGKREWLVYSSDARSLDKSAVLAGLKKIAKATVRR